MVNEAVILAGGLGTRLRDLVDKIPKSMAPIGDRPFLEYQLDYLIKNKINRVVISVGYKKEIIIDHFGKKHKSLNIVYSKEDKPLGTGGATKKAIEKIVGDLFYVLNGDTLFNVDLQRLLQFHEDKSAFVTIGLKKLSDTRDYGNIILDECFRIREFAEKKANGKFINGGVYLLSNRVFNGLEFDDKFSIEEDFFMKYTSKYKMYGFFSDVYFIDIGTPIKYKRAETQISELFS